MAWLDGKKTYLVAILLALVAAIKAVQPIFPQVAWLAHFNTGFVEAIVNFLQTGGGLAAGLACLRLAISKL